jgi:hypothetical protein
MAPAYFATVKVDFYLFRKIIALGDRFNASLDDIDEPSEISTRGCGLKGRRRQHAERSY